jgi:hypothetical protein
MSLGSPSYEQQAQEEMCDAIATQDRPQTTYRVIEARTGAVLQEGLASLGHAQGWRDRWERKNRGRAAHCDRD